MSHFERYAYRGCERIRDGARCRRPVVVVYGVCALRVGSVLLCAECDVEANETMLRWLGLPVERNIRRYVRDELPQIIAQGTRERERVARRRAG